MSHTATHGLLRRLREQCLALPGVTEGLAHAAPTWFVRGRRSFAKFIDPRDHPRFDATHVSKQTRHRGDRAEPMRQLAVAPGQHIHGASLRQWLKVVFNTRAARLGTLNELTKLGPVPIIAGALGYQPPTIERHGIGSASAYA